MNETTFKNFRPLLINPIIALSTIHEHLDYDDTFLKSIDQNSSPHLRLWELTDYAIILGRSNKKDTEVHTINSENITIIKRSSGGGTVVLGPGCLCYSLFLPTSYEYCQTITQTNQFVMSWLRHQLSPIDPHILIKGHTDLCVGEKKFSGNAQRRTRSGILFHGTFLYDFNLEKISTFLKHPSKEPVYRTQRSHKDFLINLNCSNKSLIKSLLT